MVALHFCGLDQLEYALTYIIPEPVRFFFKYVFQLIQLISSNASQLSEFFLEIVSCIRNTLTSFLSFCGSSENADSDSGHQSGQSPD